MEVNRPNRGVSAQQTIDRNDVILPESLTEDPTEDVAQVLKPSFDILWQACGWLGSINYDEQGRWKGGEPLGVRPPRSLSTGGNDQADSHSGMTNN